MGICNQQIRPYRHIASVGGVKGLRGKKLHYLPNMVVRYTDKTYLEPKKIANKFAHQFTPPPIRLAFHQLPLTGMPSFMSADTKEAIRLAKLSTAIRPDGISALQIKKLADGAINYLQSFKLNWTDT